MTLNIVGWFYDKFPIRDKRIWDCNLHYKDVEKYLSHNSVCITYHILCAWCKYNFSMQIEESEEILNEFLYGNSHLRWKNQVMFDKILINSTMNRIIDIFNIQEKRFLMYQEIRTAYGNIDPLLYFGILAAIPTLWKSTLKQTNLNRPIDIETNAQQLSGQKGTSKRIYWLLLLRLYPITNTNKLLWETDLNVFIEKTEWQKLFINFRKTIVLTKLQSFQYRLLHCALTTNVKRNKWNANISTKMHILRFLP